MKNIYLFAFLSIKTFAQTDTTEKKVELKEVLISVNKFEQSIREQPSQIEQITRKQIAFQNTPNTADLLLNTGNVFIQKSQGGGGSPVLRGFEGNRLLIVVDGVRLNNAIFRGGHLQNVLRIDQNMLQSAEILFGPSSVIYGSDALGGVINFRSRNPELNKISGNSYLRYSTATAERSGHIDFNLGKKKFGSITSLTFGSFGDIIQGKNRLEKYPDFGKRLFFVERISDTDVKTENQNVNKQIGTAYNQFDFLQKFLIQQSSKVNHLLNIQYSSTGNVPRYDRLSEQINNFPRFAEWNYGPEKRLLVSYNLNLSGSKIYNNGQITVAFQDIYESRISRRFDNPNRKSQFENVKVFSLNTDFQKLIKRNLLQYGVEFVYNDVNSTAQNLNLLTKAVSNSETRYPDGKNFMQSMAIYVTNQFRLSEKFILNAGMRYNYIKLKANFVDKSFFPFPFSNVSQNTNAISGNLGIVFNPSPKTKLSVLYSTGFRVPNIDDLTKVYESRAGQLIVPNPDIKPEFTRNYEFSFHQNIGKKFSLETTIFHTQFLNAIVLSPFKLGDKTEVIYLNTTSKVFANQNMREAKVQGFNLGFQLKIIDNLLINSYLNYTYGQILATTQTPINSKPLDHIPPTFGRTSIRYNKEKFQIEAFGIYNAWKKIEDFNPDGEDNAQYATADGMPAWNTFNVRGSYQIHRNFQMQLSIENILDKNYRYFASGVSAAGRNFILTLRGNF